MPARLGQNGNSGQDGNLCSRSKDDASIDSQTLRRQRRVILSAGRHLGRPRLAALSHLTHQVVRRRGQISAETISAFLEAGFTHVQLLELLVGVSMTTLASYMYQIATTPPDAAFQPELWMVPSGLALAWGTES